MESPDVLEYALATNDIIAMTDEKCEQPEGGTFHDYSLVIADSLPLREIEAQISKGKILRG
jgi:hypothetical protein